MTDAPVIHWFRRDLRLSDNTALREALKTGQPVIPLFVFDPALLRGESFSISRMAFLLEGFLKTLDQSLRALRDSITDTTGGLRLCCAI
ncbi:MAG: deoxyribodipyrimidine photo-lyase [Anaerolineae bacterium]